MNKHLRTEFALILLGNILLIGLIAFGVQGLTNPLTIIRLLLGLVYVLYIPGFTFQLLLFPRAEDLENIERITLSFVLSGVIIPPLALFLNGLPWGIRLWPIVISLSAFILLCMIGATIRLLGMPVDERMEPKPRLGLRKWWAEQERVIKVVYVILTIVLTTASLTAISILVTPKPAERFTEFYILGKERLAEDYLQEMTMGQVITMTTGISNKEGSVSTYNIQVISAEQVVGQAGPITLEINATWEQPVEFSIPTAGDNQLITFVLEREGQATPYRTLQLWLNIKSAQAP